MAQISKEEFEELVLKESVAMYRLAYGILRTKEDAEDAVGEAVMKAYTHMDALKEAKKSRQWLMQIVANEAKTIYVRRKKTEYVEDIELWGVSCEDGTNDLWEIVLKLDDKYRCVIILFYYDQWSIKEIGKILHISEGTVKSRLSRAKQKLKQMVV